MKFFKKRHSLKGVLFIIFIILAVVFILKLIDSRIVPAADEAAANNSAALINKKIDEIMSGITYEKNLKYTDFYTLTKNENEISSIEINSVLVNEICGETARKLSEALNNTEVEKIPLSLGLVTGFKIFSNYGPKINVRLMPMGAARADWETALTDSGINRVNYKVYLNINTSVKIISPLSSRPLEITRKYMLADITFTGTVPDTYLQVK